MWSARLLRSCRSPPQPRPSIAAPCPPSKERRQEKPQVRTCAGHRRDQRAQVQTLPVAGGRLHESVRGLDQATRSIKSVVQGVAQQQGIGASAGGERLEANTLVVKHIVPQGSTNKASLKQSSRRHNLAARARDERFNILLDWAEVRDINSPAADSDGSGIVGAGSFRTSSLSACCGRHAEREWTPSTAKVVSSLRPSISTSTEQFEDQSLKAAQV